MNILITSAGRRVALVRAFIKELRQVCPEGRVFCADINTELSAACQVADGFFNVPRVTDPDYINNLVRICIDNDIKMVVPTIDTELIPLAASKDKFSGRGINCIVSDIELVKACRNKKETNKLFNKLDLDFAKEQDINNLHYPVFIKPKDGSCSKDIYVVKSEGDFNSDYFTNSNFMVLEYLDPKCHTEFTLDIYFNKESEISCIVPRQRIETRGGEISKGITKKNFLIDYIKEKLSPINGFYGCVTMQVFVRNETNYVYAIEINPRFGGGYPLSYNSGANYPKWLIEEYFLNKKIDYFSGWEDKLLMLRYDDEILKHDSKIQY